MTFVPMNLIRIPKTRQQTCEHICGENAGSGNYELVCVYEHYDRWSCWPSISLSRVLSSACLRLVPDLEPFEDMASRTWFVNVKKTNKHRRRETLATLKSKLYAYTYEKLARCSSKKMLMNDILNRCTNMLSAHVSSIFSGGHHFMNLHHCSLNCLSVPPPHTTTHMFAQRSLNFHFHTQISLNIRSTFAQLASDPWVFAQLSLSFHFHSKNSLNVRSTFAQLSLSSPKFAQLSLSFHFHSK